MALGPLYQLILFGLVAAVLFCWILWSFWITPMAELTADQSELTRKDFYELRNGVRQTFAQAIGGTVLLIGLFFTWRNLSATERASRETLRLSQTGQITERFTRAIEHLGSNKLRLQLGAIYALERIARDSERDHWPIMEILTAYVRENAPWKEPQSLHEESPAEEPQGRQVVAPDLQAILTVLGRRARRFEHGEEQRLDLRATDLRQANLKGALLEGANLAEAHLQDADLSQARLDRANLFNACSQGADLQGASLVKADLRVAVLGHKSYGPGVNLRKAADLQGAHLDGADLFNARLEGVNLQGASLTQAILWNTHLEGARNVTVEQLATASTLYGAHLDPPLLEQIERRYPHLREQPPR